MDRFASRKLTKEKRQHQCCKVFECKVDRSHLSIHTLSHLSNLFKEAKWFYNHCLSHDDFDKVDTTVKQVPVKVGEEYEIRNLTVLPSQAKQSIKTRLFGSLMSLHALKEKGYKVGKLKFKGHVDSIPLKQYNNSYYIKNNRIRIQGMKRWLKVNGLEQIPSNAEIACATLIKKDKDYYIHITTYADREETIVPNTSIGIDFGCETQLTFSNGVKVEFQVSPSKRLRRLDRKIMKKRRKKSNNKFKDQVKRRKEYEHITNKKADIRHKVVNAITKNYKYVCFQDESIHAWHSGNHGKKIQYSGIGGILADLKHKSATPLEVNKFFPSTQLCPKCGTKRKLLLSERTYKCSCGFSMDRDIKSAICIETEAMKQVPMEHRDIKLEEISTSTFMDILSKIDCIHFSKLESLSQEAPHPLGSG